MIATMTAEEMSKAIDAEGDGAYFDHGFARWVAGEYGVPETEVQSMVRQEARDNIEDGRFKGRGKDGKAQQQACRAILAWLAEANEYSVKTDDLRDLARFAGSHRPACVWAVLVGKAAQEGLTKS